jgi:hypothetical protein
VVGGLRISTIRSLIYTGFPVLSLVSGNHVNRLLNEIEIVLLIGYSRGKTKMAVNKVLLPSIE